MANDPDRPEDRDHKTFTLLRLDLTTNLLQATEISITTKPGTSPKLRAVMEMIARAKAREAE